MESLTAFFTIYTVLGFYLAIVLVLFYVRTCYKPSFKTIVVKGYVYSNTLFVSKVPGWMEVEQEDINLVLYGKHPALRPATVTINVEDIHYALSSGISAERYQLYTPIDNKGILVPQLTLSKGLLFFKLYLFLKAYW